VQKDPEEDVQEDFPEGPAPGAWEAWKRAAAAFFRSIRSLAAIRWAMATHEASDWGKAMAVRAALLVAALVFAVCACALLVAGLVAILYAWWGTLAGAIFAVFGLCVVAIAGLVFLALRGRSARPMFQRTGEELRRDVDAFTGPES
jgi:hypothetical protein